MVGNIGITIDGIAVRCQVGMTILEAAKMVDIEIPTLCHHEDLRPSGNCRICVVEVEGSRTLAGSCHTPIEDGMVIHTHSPRALRTRRANIELLLSGHTGPCVTDDGAKDCALHDIASRLEIGPSRFLIRHPRSYPIENISPYIRRDMSKCILCRRCIRACRDVAGKDVYAMAYRGSASKVVVDWDIALDKEVCKDCGICIEYCPTSALTWPEGVNRRGGDRGGRADKNKSLQVKREQVELLDVLKMRQRESGYISEQAIEEIAGVMGISIGEVYGVATFYAFLSVRRQGRHIIRVCKSLPCYIKDSPMIIEKIKKVIGIGPGETTPDGRYSVEMTNCIGACDQSPALMIDDQVYGNLTPGEIPVILDLHK